MSAGNKKKIDDALELWGLKNRGHARGGRIGKVVSPSINNNPSPISPTGLNKLRSEVKRVVNQSPEVMVKIAKCSKDKRAIKGYLKYLSRDGALSLEDDQGLILEDRQSLNQLVKDWDETSVSGMASVKGTRRETLNLVLSMPPGTDAESVRTAVSDFAAKTFSDNPYVFVAHNDEAHPHVHLVVRVSNWEGRRLDPKKADLQRWRRGFAAELRAQGIDANATPRRARGQVIKPQSSAMVHLQKRELAIGGTLSSEERASQFRVLSAIRKQASAELVGIAPEENPAKAAIERNRASLLSEYDELQRVLSGGNDDDKRLASDIKAFTDTLPSTNTRQQRFIGEVKRRRAVRKQRDLSEIDAGSSGPKRVSPEQENESPAPKQKPSAMRRHLSKKHSGPKLG